jgi:2-polyprenyl-3-methyl-5-hydroxy-6-metoxy-1,4-benzoquinol methylase
VGYGFDDVPREVLEAFDPAGDFTRVHMLNPVLFRVLGDVRGKRILDAGCGQGYLTRILAAQGASMVGVEPARAMIEYAIEKERERPLGIEYVRADLVDLPDLGTVFDTVVSNMVLMDIERWSAAMTNCVRVLRRGGLFVFSISHPCFEEDMSAWSAKGFVEVRQYIGEYERSAAYGVNYHRPLSAYVNETIALGCVLREVVEPGVDARAVEGPGTERFVHVPNCLVVVAEKN